MSVFRVPKCGGWPGWLLGLWLALCAAAACAQELQPIPALKARVTDTAGLLAPDRQAALEARLAAIEKEHGAQVAVLIVATTQPEAIEQYSIRVTDAWQLGRKGIDDGVLVLLATEDRRLRIEVGRGLEGAIPDAVAKRIIAEIAAPRFRQGDFAGGLDAVLEQIGKLIAGESLPPPKQATRSADNDGMDLESMAALGMVATVLIGGVLRTLFGQLSGALLVGGMVGVGAWLLSGALLVGAVAAVLSFIFSLALASGGRGGRGGGLGGGGWPSGGGGGWKSGGSSGWSGGGGGFGGGGASGDW